MSSLAETLVHNKSSSVHYSICPSYRDTLIGSSNRDMDKVEYIYRNLDSENYTKKLERLLECRTGAYFVRNFETGQVRVASQSCHLRFCPICTKTRTLVIKSNVTSWLKTSRFPKLLTFTLKHSTLPLSDQIDRLYDSFKAIRRTSILKKTCYAGVWFFQVKKSETDFLFHPHIHCLVAGAFIPQKKLAKAWYKITKDSNIVDVRAVKDAQTCARHVSRYAANPCSLKPLTLSDCVTLAKALESRRLCGTWGQCRKLKLTSLPKIDTSKWHNIGSWQTVYYAQKDSIIARQIINAWRTGQPLDQGVDMRNFFDEIDDKEKTRTRGSPWIDSQTYLDWRYSK